MDSCPTDNSQSQCNCVDENEGNISQRPKLVPAKRGNLIDADDTITGSGVGGTGYDDDYEG
jgi:hypothetical protein